MRLARPAATLGVKKGGVMTIVKEHRFPASVRWLGGRLTRVSAPEKDDLEVAVPPEFRGGIEGVWSPEELLVAATASCYAVTVVALLERLGIPLLDLAVDGVGHVTKRADGKLGFVAIEVTAKLVTEAEAVAPAEAAAREAKEACLVSLALEVPVHVVVRVSASKKEFVLGAA
jgi:organic hydroperoxide reductase OsmC/OhrA